MRSSKGKKLRIFMWITAAVFTLGLAAGGFIMWKNSLLDVIRADMPAHTLNRTATVKLPAQWLLRHESDSRTLIVSPNGQLKVALEAQPAGSTVPQVADNTFTETLNSGNLVQHSTLRNMLTALVTNSAGASVTVTAETTDNSDIELYKYEIAKIVEDIQFLP